MRSGRRISWLADQTSGLLDLFFPRLCPICLLNPVISTGDLFCSTCQADIHPLPGGCCPRCALPFRARGSTSHLCEDCSRQPPPFRQVVAVGLYQGALKEALLRFKYSAHVELDRPLAALLAAALEGSAWQADLLVPVPLHVKKLRQRGFNQALLLTRLLACHLRKPLEKTLLERCSMAHSQQGLSARARRGNLRGAFYCNRQLAGERLLLVDDVMTTGATLASCSQALLDAGASSVDALVVARAPRF